LRQRADPPQELPARQTTDRQARIVQPVVAAPRQCSGWKMPDERWKLESGIWRGAIESRVPCAQLTLGLQQRSSMAAPSKSKAQVLPTHTPALFDSAVARAAELLRAGELVALPTETVYGLAANALDPRAVGRIFEVKGRPPHNPVIVHVAGIAMARGCVRQWPERADHLARAFWPGPLTLVLARSREIPDIVTAAGPTVGVRWPNHPFIQAVMRACDFPLAAPSANLSTEISPTN